MLTFAGVSLGEGGAPACVSCHGSGPSVAYRSSSEVEADVAAAISAPWDPPGPNIELTGPEPFGHPELPSIVAAAVRSGVSRLRLHTDACALALPANAAGSIAAGVRQVRFTVLGGTAGVHDALAASPGSLEHTLDGVRSFVAAARAQDAPVHVEALVPVCRHNVRDLPAAVGEAGGAGADAVLVRVDDGGIDLPGAIEWIAAACDTGMVNAVWVEVEGVPFCMLTEHVLHLADVYTARPGSKATACAKCALDRMCGGAPAGASAETLALLRPPDGHQALAARVEAARTAGPGRSRR